MENFIFCAVHDSKQTQNMKIYFVMLTGDQIIEYWKTYSFHKRTKLAH